MADPLPFFVTHLDGHNLSPIIPYEFYSTHLEGKNEFMKLKLTSDALDKTWEVKLNGRRFAGGWEDFSAAHCFQNDDVLTFRHDGDEFFHVTPSRRSISQSQIQSISSTSSDSEDDDDSVDDDGVEDDDDDDDDDDETSDEYSDSKNISLKKKSRFRTESSSSSSENSCLLAVTPSNLRLNRVSLTKHFTRTNGLDKRWCGIDLMNQSGTSWGLNLRYNTLTGQDFISGWRNFCRAIKLETGSSYRFKVVRNGTRPMLRLCSDITPQGNCSKAKGKAKVSANSCVEVESASMKQNRFLIVTLKPYMLKSRQVRITKHFARGNGIAKAGEIILVDRNGLMWPSYVAISKEQGGFYMAKSWISFCVANGVKMGETFTLEFVREEGTTPMFKFCSKAKRGQAQFDGTSRTVQASRDEEGETEIRVQKRARDSAKGGTSRRIGESSKSSPVRKNLNRKRGQAQFDGTLRTVQASWDEEEEEEEEMERPLQKRARVSAEAGTSRRDGKSGKSNYDLKNLQRKRPQQPCSIFDQLKKVKQSIVDTQKWCKTVRSELKMKEQSLKALLREIDALGENVLEINKIFKQSSLKVNSTSGN